MKADGSTSLVITNAGKTSLHLKNGTTLGRVVEAKIINNPQNVLVDEGNMSV